jgi:hypothetical protein
VNPKKLLAHDPNLLTERDLSSLVVELARLGGWTHRYHTWSSQKSPRGFPDWILVKDGRMLAVELKSEKGPVRPEQTEWLDALSEVPGVECYLWRPSDWDEIVLTLTGKSPKRTDHPSPDAFPRREVTSPQLASGG